MVAENCPFFVAGPFRSFYEFTSKLEAMQNIHIYYKFYIYKSNASNPKGLIRSESLDQQQLRSRNFWLANSPQGVLLRMERLLSKYLSRFAASRSRAATFEDAAERRVKAMQRYLANQPTENWMEELKELSLSS